MAQNVREFMTSNVVSLPPSTALRDAAAQMRDQGIGDVLVVEGENLVGIVTDRDIVTKAVAEGRPVDATTLGDIRSADLICLEPDDSLERALETMRDADVRRLPVVERGRAIGVVSLGDIAQVGGAGEALADMSDAPPNN